MRGEAKKGRGRDRAGRRSDGAPPTTTSPPGEEAAPPPPSASPQHLRGGAAGERAARSCAPRGRSERREAGPGRAVAAEGTRSLPPLVAYSVAFSGQRPKVGGGRGPRRLPGRGWVPVPAPAAEAPSARQFLPRLARGEWGSETGSGSLWPGRLPWGSRRGHGRPVRPPAGSARRSEVCPGVSDVRGGRAGQAAPPGGAASGPGAPAAAGLPPQARLHVGLRAPGRGLRRGPAWPRGLSAETSRRGARGCSGWDRLGRSAGKRDLKQGRCVSPGRRAGQAPRERWRG